MRAAQVCATVDDLTAGPSHSVVKLCEGLRRRGVETELHTVLGWRAEPVVSLDYLRRHRQDLAGVPGLSQVCLSSTMLRALRASADRVDVMHTHGLWLMPNIYPAWAAKRASCKTLLSPRGMLGRAALGFSSTKKAVFWRFFQAAAVASTDCIHATSEAEYQEVRSFGIKAPVAIVPNGVDLPPTIDGSQGARRTILSLGRVHPKKGLPNLIQAWARLEQQYPEWDLRIVGPSELGHADELRGLAAKLGLSRVGIEGALLGEAKAKAYAEADLFVLPTLNENFALTVAEALAAGVPVISTHGAPWCGLKTERCGWWIDHGVDALEATLVAALSADRAQLQAMGRRGQDWMLREFSWDSVAARTREVYAWLSSGGQPPACVRVS